MPAIPNSAAINEAVEIAKNYEPAEVVSFINGILGSFVRAVCRFRPKPEKEGGGSGGAGGAGGMTMPVLGLDTSNYTTSAAVFDGAGGCNAGRLLGGPPRRAGAAAERRPVPACEAAPGAAGGAGGPRTAPGPEGSGGASTRPRTVEGSYMPCFLAGESHGRALAAALGGAVFCLLPPAGAPGGGGLVRRADGPAGRSLPGLAPVRRHHRAAAGPAPGGPMWRRRSWAGPATSPLASSSTAPASCWGFSSQLAKALDELYPQADACYRVKLKDLTFSLSGMENQVKRLLAEGEAPANVARFTLDTVCSVVLRATQEAQRRCPGLPVLCSGGVASNRQLRAAMERRSCGALFAQPLLLHGQRHGVAILTRRALEGGSWHERRDHPQSLPGKRLYQELDGPGPAPLRPAGAGGAVQL